MSKPYKKIFINVQEFKDLVLYIKEHPVDRTRGSRDPDISIPETGRAYWNEALEQVLECLVYIHNATPLTAARKASHDQKIKRYSDDRLLIYEYVRTEIIEKNGGSSKKYEK